MDVSQGKGLEFVPGVVDQASTHLGRIRQEVKKTKTTTNNEKNWNILRLEEHLDKIDLEERKLIGDDEDEKEMKLLYSKTIFSFCRCR